MNNFTGINGVYRGKKIGWAFYLIGIIYFFVGVCLPIAYGLWLSFYDYIQYGPISTFTLSWYWYIVGIINIFILISLSFYRIKRSYPIITVYNNGLAIKQFLQASTYIRWLDVKGIAERVMQYQFWGSSLFSIHSTDIFIKDSSKIIIKCNIQGFPDLLEAIKSMLYPKLFAKIKEEFATEDWVSFGALSINPDFLRNNSISIIRQESQYPWISVKEMIIRNGSLEIVVSEKAEDFEKIKIPTSKIMNLELFFRLIREEVV